MPLTLPFAGVDRRTALVRAILQSACLVGLLASAPVWRNWRTFPMLPIAPGFPILPAPWDSCLFGSMLLALVLACWFYRAAITFLLIAGLFAFCEDQNRGQPWFYLYWVMLGLTLLPAPAAMAACRWTVSVAYIWSGVQKCQPAFFHGVPAWFVAPATQWHLPAAVIHLLRWSVASAPCVELGIGVALWLPRFRWAAIGAAAVVHLTALLFLGPLGYNYDVVVWPWNLAMLGLVIALFAIPPAARITRTLADLRPSKPGLATLALVSFLPLLSYFGWWDSYFSFTLYAGNQAKADIFVTEAFSKRLPPGMRAHVHQVRQAYNPQIQGPYVFDFLTWGFQELHVPPIVEPRSFRSIFNFLRTYSVDPNDLRMIVGPRAGPTVFYQGDRHWPLTPSEP
jgi:hypothetical protein